MRTAEWLAQHGRGRVEARPGGAGSSDGSLRHARNFDFPGAGVWDAAPAVVLCEPDEGLRYGFVTTRGADVPGVSGFNEAGITLTAHTRFHREVNFRGASVVDIGHEVVRRARTIDDAVRIAREQTCASTWGLLVSSASEQDAVLIETTGKAIEAVGSRPGATSFACTNRYQAPSLAAGEVAPSALLPQHSDARCARLVEAAGDGPLSADDLAELLGDRGASLNGETRLLGSCLASPISVQSIVSEPEQSRIRVSVGTAPTGFGPYVDVAWDWDGEVGYELFDHPPPAEPDEHAVLRDFVTLARHHLLGAAPGETRARLLDVAQRAPDEPHLRFLAGIAEAREGHLDRAQEHLDTALALEHDTFRRAQSLLWRARVRSAAGQRDGARTDRKALAGLEGGAIEKFQSQGKRDGRWTRRRFRRVALDLFMVGAE